MSSISRIRPTAQAATQTQASEAPAQQTQPRGNQAAQDELRRGATQMPQGPVPTPYPNIAQVSQTSQAPKKVKVAKKDALALKAQAAPSMGDEAGTARGTKSAQAVQGVSERWPDKDEHRKEP